MPALYASSSDLALASPVRATMRLEARSEDDTGTVEVKEIDLGLLRSI